MTKKNFQKVTQRKPFWNILLKIYLKENQVDIYLTCEALKIIAKQEINLKR